MSGCRHNQRTRYTNGYYCNDCNQFFSKDSPTYRGTELLTSIWMVLNNINAERLQAGLPVIEEVQALRDKIGFCVKRRNPEKLIAAAEIMMAKYGVNSESASVVLDS